MDPEALAARLDALESRNAELETLVWSLSRERMEPYIAAIVRGLLYDHVEMEAPSVAISMLREWLSLMVPLHVLELRQRGGPTEADFAEARNIGELMGTYGDALMYAHTDETSAKEKTKARELKAKLARSLAVAAFVPGGVKLFGMHFCEHAERGAYPLERERAERDGWERAAYDAVRADLDRQFAERPAYARSPRDKYRVVWAPPSQTRTPRGKPRGEA